MPEIKLDHITKHWGRFYGVDDLSITIQDNAFVTMLGPSGCGKTTVLRMIAGLETPTTGRISIGDRVVFDSSKGINVPPNKRKVGFLFQNYALWPNMTVYQNISFGLTNIKEPLPEINFDAKIAARLAELLENADEVRKVLDECRTKDGSLDEKRAVLKFIDTFTLSIFTAEKLLNYHVEKAKDLSSEIAKLRDVVDEAKSAAKANGAELDGEFRTVKNGEIVKNVRKLTAEEIDLTVRRVSRIVKIGMFMDRYPAELSGGQQQRVAIARTLAPEPDVLFMDEPLSNLDAKLRLEMRYELQRLHLETGSTFVYVTHDQMEAMTLATQICLINNGVLQQYAAPLTLYHQPKNLFAADFVGNPSINFVEAKAKQNDDGTIALTALGGKSAVFRPSSPTSLAEAAKVRAATPKIGTAEKSNKDERFLYHIDRVGEPEEAVDPATLTIEDVVLGIRPEFLDIAESGALTGHVYGVMPTGMESTVKIRVGDFLLTGVIFGGDVISIGAPTAVRFKGNNILLFDRLSGEYICDGSLEFV